MPHTPSILILEDNPDRLRRFTDTLHLIAPNHHLHTWRHAHRMIAECPPLLAHARLICLDHDLDPLAGETADPGDGLDVARFLAPLRPPCPILIHSSNADGAARMLGEFQLANCLSQTILPFGDHWIEQFWAPRVKSLLRS